MAIGWLTVLKAVPWTDVISNAPKITDGAKKLWKAVAKKPQSSEVIVPASSNDSMTGNASAADLEKRLARTEAKLADLHGQMLSSVEIIKELSEQNNQLIKRIELNRVRTIRLGVVAVLALIAAALSLYMLMAK